MKISPEELCSNKSGNSYQIGYRLVYFYENSYSIGAYCKTIEGFMVGFAENDPILGEDDIPNFISVDDILDRTLKMIPNAIAIGMYKIDGTCIQKKYRTTINIK